MKEEYFTARGVTVATRLNAFGVPKADNEATYVVLRRTIFSSIEKTWIGRESLQRRTFDIHLTRLQIV